MYTSKGTMVDEKRSGRTVIAKNEPSSIKTFWKIASRRECEGCGAIGLPAITHAYGGCNGVLKKTPGRLPYSTNLQSRTEIPSHERFCTNGALWPLFVEQPKKAVCSS